MEIRLNLATRPLENFRRFVFVCGTIGALLLGWFYFLGVQAYRTWNENKVMREEMARLQSDLREFRTQRKELEEFFRRDETKRVMDRAAFLNGLIEQRSFPWTRIFMDLERLLPAGARVVSLAPRREEGRIELRLVIGAQNAASKVKFLKALEEAPQFERVVVNSESRKEGTAAGEDPVSIELAARYRAFEDAPAKKPVPGKGAQ